MSASSMSRQTLGPYFGLYLINLRKQVLRTLREICIYIYIQDLLNYNKYKSLSNKLVTKIKKILHAKGKVRCISVHLINYLIIISHFKHIKI